MEIQPGKHWGLRRLADAGGRFKMVAVDQRPPVEKLIASRKGKVEFADMIAVKRLLASELAHEGTAILCDPNYAYPATIDVISPNQGLILTLEDHRFEDTPAGRKSKLIRDWSVAKIRRIGADGVKVLAWYRPDAGAEVREHQKEFVRGVGLACREHDIPCVLELLAYPFPGTRGHVTDYVEDPNKFPGMVIDSVAEFADARYGVDLFKLESPIPASALPSPDGGEQANAAQALFDRLGRATSGRPWVMLSAGANMADFEKVLVYAYRAGANGYLAGRAIWWDALQAFPDLERCAQLLRAAGVPYMRRLNALTDRAARGFEVHADFSWAKAEGDLAHGYAEAHATP